MGYHHKTMLHQENQVLKGTIAIVNSDSKKGLGNMSIFLCFSRQSYMPDFFPQISQANLKKDKISYSMKKSIISKGSKIVKIGITCDPSFDITNQLEFPRFSFHKTGGN